MSSVENNLGDVADQGNALQHSSRQTASRCPQLDQKVSAIDVPSRVGGPRLQGSEVPLANRSIKEIIIAATGSISSKIAAIYRALTQTLRKEEAPSKSGFRFDLLGQPAIEALCADFGLKELKALSETSTGGEACVCCSPRAAPLGAPQGR